MHLQYLAGGKPGLGGQGRAVSAERAGVVRQAGTGEDQATSPARELALHDLVRFGYGSLRLRLAELLDQLGEGRIPPLFTNQLA